MESQYKDTTKSSIKNYISKGYVDHLCEFIAPKDSPCPPGIEMLESSNVFIVQQNLNVSCMNRYRTHKVLNENKHVLFRGHHEIPFLSPNPNKFILSNFRKRNVILLELLQGECSQDATVFCPVDTPIGHVIKYGGKFASPSFEITNMENKVIFTAEPHQLGTGILEYTVSAQRIGKVAHIGVKSGLNHILTTGDRLQPLDKAMLLGFVIALMQFITKEQ